MEFACFRTQHPVGQGTFHSGILHGERVLRYVYDCGAMAKYAKPRDIAIDNFLSTLDRRAVLDILFVSHAHADHINGVQRLLRNKTKLSVDTIMMPLLSLEERLLAYGRTLTEDILSAESEFYREFIANPVTALNRFGPRRIILVKRGKQPGGAPYSDDPNNRPDSDSRRSEQIFDFQELGWKLVGYGDIGRVQSEGDGSNTHIFLMDDTLALEVRTKVTSGWLLAPYVDPVVNSKLKSFIKELAKALAISVAKLKANLLNSAWLEDLLVNKVSQLKSAYSNVALDLNITSLCLYSGPSDLTSAVSVRYMSQFGGWKQSTDDSTKIAWLGTGDAALANKMRRASFLRHFNRLLDFVNSFVLPHHGSDHNFHVDLLKRTSPNFFIAAADKYSNWRHPGTAVVQATASVGRFVSTVTSSPKSAIAEFIRLS